MIQARNIHKTFGSLEVLKGIDIDIEPGRVTAIVGPSGAGKTTLLQILGTLSSADAGGVLRYDGMDLTALSDSKLSRFRNSNIGFVFQFHRLLPEFTLIENVAMPALIGGASRQEAFAKARALLGMLLAILQVGIVMMGAARGYESRKLYVRDFGRHIQNIIFWSLLAALGMMLCLGVQFICFGLPYRGTVLGGVLLLLIYAITITCMGYIVGSLVPERVFAVQA